jgi:nonribosomal peptide synthetase DhbF
MTEGDSAMATPAVQDVEDALATFPDLADVTVVEQSVEADDERLVAYVTSGGAELDVSALHAHARKLLPGHLVPAAIVVLDTLPVTAEGGVDHQALPTADLEGLMPYQAPDSPRQEALCSIFAEVLGVPRVGVSDNFFDLDGQSLEALLLSARITSTLGVEVSMADLFDAPTVAELDQLIDERSRAR